MMRISDMSKLLDRLEESTVGPWDTTVDQEGKITLTSPNREVLADNISVQDAWFISHSKDDIKVLLDEVLDLRRLVFDVCVLLDDKEEHGLITKYIEAFMKDRIG